MFPRLYRDIISPPRAKGQKAAMINITISSVHITKTTHHFLLEVLLLHLDLDATQSSIFNWVKHEAYQFFTLLVKLKKSLYSSGRYSFLDKFFYQDFMRFWNARAYWRWEKVVFPWSSLLLAFFLWLRLRRGFLELFRH